MVIDLDDMGANRVISDQCQSHDCRDKLDQLHYANPNFKVTLFAIPAEMTSELLEWCEANKSWIELAVHGWKHSSNYECVDWTYEEMDKHMKMVEPMNFTKGFKAPGWQISDGCYEWLKDNGWWVADQSYNDERRPKELKAYVNNDGRFAVWNGQEWADVAEAWHGHTYNCVGNGIYERFDEVANLVKNATEFQFVSEVVGA